MRHDGLVPCCCLSRYLLCMGKALCWVLLTFKPHLRCAAHDAVGCSLVLWLERRERPACRDKQLDTVARIRGLAEASKNALRALWQPFLRRHSRLHVPHMATRAGVNLRDEAGYAGGVVG